MNIILAGVGGQGLVLTTDMICEVAFREGYDVKSNDVVGLSQRGGKVWGSVKFDEKIHSPNIAEGEADILLALEPLEGLRWQSYLRKGGKILINSSEIYPVFAIAEQSPYPSDFEKQVREDVDVIITDAQKIALETGTVKVVNVVMMGMLAKHLAIDPSIWKEVIAEKVPPKFLEMNLEAFEKGMKI